MPPDDILHPNYPGYIPESTLAGLLEDSEDRLEILREDFAELLEAATEVSDAWGETISEALEYSIENLRIHILKAKGEK